MKGNSMGDMSRFPHDNAVGYCDICSPGWAEMLFKHSVEDDIYQRGIEKGRKELEASNKAMTEKLEFAEAVLAGDGVLVAENEILKATIESLNLRVVRLVDALTEAADLADVLVESMDYLGTGSNSKSANKEREDDRAIVVRLKSALSAEQDNEWLMEQKALALEDAAMWFDGKRYWHFMLDGLGYALTTESQLRRMASELRQPKKSPEIDLDHEMRKA
jgi:hypothetical protein